MDRSTWWSITSFNDEIQIMENLMDGSLEMPSWLKEVYGGRELCPSTNKEHFQGALHTSQIRMTQVKKMLPTSHIEKVKSDAECLKRYVMKNETAIGEKKKLSNPKFITLEGLMELVAKEYLDKHGVLSWDRLHEMYTGKDVGYDVLSYNIVLEKPYLANLCSQPQSQRCWSKYGQAFIQNALKEYSGE